ncbi:hypothetical protein SKAU_G00016010 [Synaphobranchus kaupii]|uniref:Uncharacterized protein n=1 Tax=Synaphobranchus kaupii TaxID=118154 RepID=A0A9Q1GC27_SYNKA|nr:hypothetical protein SKAU_G00016010 [Synaphobranchus kaupii]
MQKRKAANVGAGPEDVAEFPLQVAFPACKATRLTGEREPAAVNVRLNIERAQNDEHLAARRAPSAVASIQHPRPGPDQTSPGCRTQGPPESTPIWRHLLWAREAGG